MAAARRAVPSAAMPEPSRYNAFISYSHAADSALAQALQQGLHRLAKLWWRPPTLRIFRDQTSLSASAALWPEIERQLARSDWLILMASPQAAGSPWVARELQWWLDHRPVDRLLIVISGGELAWERHAGDFDWARTTCLPPVLRGHCRDEPLYVDLRWAGTVDPLTLRHPRFRDAVLTLASRLHGLTKDALDSDDLRQHRRLQQVAMGAAAMLGALALATGLALWNFWQARGEAQANWREARSRELAARALSELAVPNTDRIDPLLLALMAWRLAPTGEAQGALTRVTEANPMFSGLTGWHSAGLADWAFSADGQQLVTVGLDGSLQARAAPDWRPLGPMAGGAPPQTSGVSIAPDSRQVLVWSDDGALALWAPGEAAARPLRWPGLRNGPGLVAAAGPQGRWLAAGRRDGGLSLWQVDAGAPRPVPPALAALEVLGLQFDAQGVLWVAARGRAGGPQLLRWDPRQAAPEFGPATASDHDLAWATTARWAGTPQRLALIGHGVATVFDIATPGLALRRVARLQGVSDARCDGAQLTADGRQMWARRLNAWQRWAVADPPSPVASGPVETFGCSRFSADGRWRADSVKAGWRAEDAKNERLLVWPTQPGASVPPLHLDTACNFRDAPQRCVQQLCDRLSPWVDAQRLRTLFGIENYEVMFERYEAAIGGPLCPVRTR